MAKAWADMDTQEKLDYLRNESVPREQFEQLRRYTQALEQGISSAHAKIEKIEKELNSPPETF